MLDQMTTKTEVQATNEQDGTASEGNRGKVFLHTLPQGM